MTHFKSFLKSISILLLSTLLIEGCSKSPDFEPEEPDISKEKLTQIHLDTKGGTIVDEPKIEALITVSKADKISFEGTIGIEIRGASSQMFPKKSYGFETWDENNEGIDVSILDMPDEEDWILYAPYSDKSLMRNVLIYDLSRDMGRYASRTKFVELTLNNVYKGVYVFMEKLKRNAERININKLKEDENSGEDVTGGYILKIDKLAGSNLGAGYNELNSFMSKHKPKDAAPDQEVTFLYEYPKAKDITQEQKAYISSYVAQFEEALVSDDYKDIDVGYRAYIDVPSFIDFFLLNELSHNVDGYRLSTYMYKEKNEKLKMGPIWDFNLAFGNADYCGGENTNTWAYRFNERCPQYGNVPFWWDKLLQDPAFVTKLKDRWNELRASVILKESINAKIDNYVTSLETSGAIPQNFKAWNVLGIYIWPNNYVGTTYDDEIKYLKNWISDRLAWMDGAINNL